MYQREIYSFQITLDFFILFNNVLSQILRCAMDKCVQIGCVSVFMFGVGLPFMFTILHSSLRLRNIKNKVCILS